MEFHHASVLLWETIEGLKIKPQGIYVDGTLGGGGHSLEILKRLGENGRLVGIDQDERANFRNTGQVLRELGITGIDGMLLDLGVSSYQLDTKERGFSYRFDAPLDMRMDRRQRLTAKEIVNGYDERELYRVIKDYGEDKFAKNIARHIVAAREKKQIETTGELNEIIKAAIPARMREKGGHPSKRTFQAIRIECNRELEVLKEVLEEVAEFLNPGGRLCIITFHSLEDRIVKTAFKTAANPCICPPEFPVCVCGRKSKGRVITGKPVLPGEEELLANPRAGSAKLRIFERSVS